MRPELEVQKFLRLNGPVFGRLEADHGIKAKQHPKFPSLYLLKYGIGADFKNPLVQECRGLILDAANNFNVVAMPYTKFFNHSEALAHPIDWATAKVWEKLDGSLLTLYWHNGWQVATSGTPAADVPINGSAMTFAELFWKTFHAEEYCIYDFQPSNTYMFELCAPENRVVVQHAAPYLRIHGVRDNYTLQEKDVEAMARTRAWKLPKRLPVTSIEECTAAAAELNPLEGEGYIVCDADFRRVKVKSMAYIALHHSKDLLLTKKKMALIIRDGEAAEFEAALGAFPELTADFYSILEKYMFIVSTSLDFYRKVEHIEEQPIFAMAVMKHAQFAPILFAMRSKKCGPAAVLKNMTTYAFLRLMNLKD